MESYWVINLWAREDCHWFNVNMHCQCLTWTKSSFLVFLPTHERWRVYLIHRYWCFCTILSRVILHMRLLDSVKFIMARATSSTPSAGAILVVLQPIAIFLFLFHFEHPHFQHICFCICLDHVPTLLFSLLLFFSISFVNHDVHFFFSANTEKQ